MILLPLPASEKVTNFETSSLRKTRLISDNEIDGVAKHGTEYLRWLPDWYDDDHSSSN